MKDLFQINPGQATKLFDLFAPILSFVLAAMLWMWVIEPEADDMPYVNYIYLIGLFVVTYEFGYKIYYKRERHKFFLVAFILPLIVGIIGGIGLYRSFG